MTDIQSRYEDITLDLAGDGANTRIEYGYADASNYKTRSHVVLAGRISPEQIEALLSTRSDHEFFIPSQVGMRDLQGDFEHGSDWDEDDDHVWHCVEEFVYTDEKAGELSVQDLVDAWPKDAKDWDVVGTLNKLEGGYGL